MKHLRASDYKIMPWKNGGGETTEVAVFPQGASMEEFGWRVSMAKVASDGPFSVFPEIDRTLSILDGAGIELTINGAKPQLLTKDSEPLSFPADAPVAATLIDGTIIDLNVMTRRGHFTHHVSVVAQPLSFQAKRDEIILVVADGGVTMRSGESLVQLQHRDCALIDSDTQCHLAPNQTGASAYLVTICSVRAS